MENGIAEKLAVEEFRQMREEIRQRELAVQQILTIAIAGTTAVLAI
jgi:hypothetical protein